MTNPDKLHLRRLGEATFVPGSVAYLKGKVRPGYIGCFAEGCEAEGRIMLHVPGDQFAELCMDHAREIAPSLRSWAQSCGCVVCQRALALIGQTGN